MGNIQKQLIAKLGEEFANIFPLQYVSNILDKATGETLTILLSRYNHIFIPFTGGKGIARVAVPPIMRRKGLYITYITPNSKIITEYFKGNKTEVNNEDWVKDKNWGTNLTSDNFVPITLPDGSVTAEKLSQEVLDLIGQGFKGNIENHPDGEDLTSVELATINNTKYKVLKFADRNYTQDGMGYVILRKNKTFAEQVTKSNTIYEIRYNFDLGSSIVSIPEGCVLKFEGGSVSNGTIVFSNTTISGNAKLFISASGTIANTSIPLNWFGLSPNADDNSVLFSRIQNLNCSYRELTLEHGNYNFSQTIVFEQSNVTFRGISGRTFGGSDVTLVITVDDVLLRLKGTRYQIKDITFAGSIDARTASVGLMFSRVDNPDSTTESVLASIDSKIENCQFYNLWRGIYVLGNQIRLSDLSFSRCMQGMAFDTFTGESPMYYGSNGRSYVISRCNFHSMVSTDLANGCIVILNRDCICFQISGCHQDCETHFIVGQALTRSTVEDNMIANVTQGGIRVSRIYNSIITGNSFLSSLGTDNPVINDSPSNRLRQGIYATVDAFSSIISNNYFDYCDMEHIRLEKSLNITITGNTFRRWGQSITEANKCAIWLPGSTARVTVTANTFEQDTQANSYLAYIQDGSKSVFADNIINTKNGAKIVRYTVGETVQACFNVDNNVTSDIIVPASDNISSIDSVTNKEGFFYVYNNSGGGLPLGIISADITVRRITIDKLLKVLIPFDLSYGVWTQVVDLTNSTITKWTPMNKALTRPVSNYGNFDSTDTGALHWDGTSLKIWNGTAWINISSTALT